MFNQGPGEQDVIITAVIHNPYNFPVEIISGEYEFLNKRILNAKEKISINIEVPKGYREFVSHNRIDKNKGIMYIGLVNKEAVEPIIHRANI